MRKNGFIATTLIYSFMLTFLVLTSAIVGIVLSNRVNLSKIIKSISDELNNNFYNYNINLLSKDYIENFSYNGDNYFKYDTINNSEYTFVLDKDYDVTCISNGINVDVFRNDKSYTIKNISNNVTCNINIKGDYGE